MDTAHTRGPTGHSHRLPRQTERGAGSGCRVHSTRRPRERPVSDHQPHQRRPHQRPPTHHRRDGPAGSESCGHTQRTAQRSCTRATTAGDSEQTTTATRPTSGSPQTSHDERPTPQRSPRPGPGRARRRRRAARPLTPGPPTAAAAQHEPRAPHRHEPRRRPRADREQHRAHRARPQATHASPDPTGDKPAPD